MEKNVGKIDQYLRITAGLTMLGVGIRRDSLLMMMAGSMKVAEGITRWCPMLHALGLSTKEEALKARMNSMDMDLDMDLEEIFE